MSAVPRRTYAGPPIAHGSSGPRCRRQPQNGRRWPRRRHTDATPQYRAFVRADSIVGTRPARISHGCPRLSLSVHCVCGLGVFEANDTLSQRYHTHGITLATPHPVWTSHPSAMSLRFVRLHAPRKVERSPFPFPLPFPRRPAFPRAADLLSYRRTLRRVPGEV